MGLLNVGVGGLLANQAAITTTGQNIANANVESYSRQELLWRAQVPQSGVAGFIGRGVEIEAVRRITDAFLTQQLQMSVAQFNEYQTLSAEAGQLDSLLSETGIRLDTAIDSFFSALQNVADSPSSPALRQLVLSEGDSLAQRFHRLDGYLMEQQSAVERQLSRLADEANRLSSAIADLNGRLAGDVDRGADGSRNGLLDQRDELLRQLSELLSFSTSSQSGGGVNVLIGGGQALVVDGQANRLKLQRDVFSPQRMTLSLVDASGRTLTEDFSGGRISGLLRYRDEILSPTAAAIDVLALTLMSAINYQHQLGIDLDGRSGAEFFAPLDVAARVMSSRHNADPSDRQLAVTIDNAAALTGGDYRLQLEGGAGLTYRLLRNSDSVQVASGHLNSQWPQTVVTDQGFSIEFQGGSFQAGDQFLLRPAATAAADIELAIKTPASLALSSPIVVSAQLGNSGSAVMVPSTAAGHFSGDLLAVDGDNFVPTLILFTSATTYDVLDNSDPSNPQHFIPPLKNQPFVAGQNNLLLPFDRQSRLVSSVAGHVFTAEIGNSGTVSNGYPSPGVNVETITVSYFDAERALPVSSSVDLLAGESAAIAATRLSTLHGVSATANTELSVELVDDGDSNPLRIRLNGVDLTDPAVSPLTTELLAERINDLFSGSGITARNSGSTLALRSLNGADLRLENFSSDSDDRIVITNVNGATASGEIDAGQEAVVGGVIDVMLEENLTPSGTGGLFTGAALRAVPIEWEYPLFISGSPQAGDKFSLQYNRDAGGDNRNALALISLSSAELLTGGADLLQGVNRVVGAVASQAAQANSERAAADSLLAQSRSRRDSLSAVNLDEEAARLIQYQQAYAASAQVINTSRELFDSLLQLFR